MGKAGNTPYLGGENNKSKLFEKTKYFIPKRPEQIHDQGSVAGRRSDSGEQSAR